MGSVQTKCCSHENAAKSNHDDRYVEADGIVKNSMVNEDFISKKEHGANVEGSCFPEDASTATPPSKQMSLATAEETSTPKEEVKEIVANEQTKKEAMFEAAGAASEDDPKRSPSVINEALDRLRWVETGPTEDAEVDLVADEPPESEGAEDLQGTSEISGSSNAVEKQDSLQVQAGVEAQGEQQTEAIQQLGEKNKNRKQRRSLCLCGSKAKVLDDDATKQEEVPLVAETKAPENDAEKNDEVQ